MRPIELPTTPPPLDEMISLSDGSIQQIADALDALSRDLDGLPVIVSQKSQIIASAGVLSEAVPERLARVTERLWRDGVRHPAREVIRFEEESIEEVERANYMLYSVHIMGALTLTVGWQTTISLTQVREEVADVKRRMLRILHS